MPASGGTRCRPSAAGRERRKIVRTILALIAILLAPLAWASAGSAGEEAAGLFARDLPEGPHATAPEQPLLLEGAEDPGVWHPWTAYGNWGMSRINLGVALFDNPDINEAASYEWQLHCRVIGTWGVGVTLGGGWGTNSGTGRLLSPGTIETGLALASTNVDIPLGRGRAPIISLGGGIGGYYVDPNVDSDLRDDLDAQNRRRDQGHYWFTDTRARADLLIPLDRKRYAFLGLGVARDWAEGDITATVRNTNTGATVSKRTERVNFDRTTYQLSLVVLF